MNLHHTHDEKVVPALRRSGSQDYHDDQAGKQDSALGNDMLTSFEVLSSLQH